jgi:peptide/nickel transport system permease protein
MLSAESNVPVFEAPARSKSRAWRLVRRYPLMIGGGSLIVAMLLMAILAPVLWTTDPLNINPIERLRAPSADHWFGTDMLGRDVYSRTLYGSRISLIVGFCVATAATGIGLLIGVVSGYNRYLDSVVMRIMDGMMSIPAILLAIALMALTRASVSAVIVALTLPEIPRVVRLVRGLVLTIRENVYVEAAQAIGAGFTRVVLRHILPNTLTPLIVQATYICASAVIYEAYLSFLGAGTPPEIPSWGNIMSEGRIYIQLGFWIVLFPGICLGLTVLGINLLGDGLRDTLDPRLAKRM